MVTPTPTSKHSTSVQLSPATPAPARARKGKIGAAKSAKRLPRGASIQGVATNGTDNANEEVPTKREDELRIRLFGHEKERLEKVARGAQLSTWARRVLLATAAKKPRTGPGPMELHAATAARAWLATLLDELLREDTTAADRARALELAATLVDERPNIFDEGGGPC
jgi:hypothetical protein